jgi:hypothetical protein
MGTGGHNLIHFLHEDIMTCWRSLHQSSLSAVSVCCTQMFIDRSIVQVSYFDSAYCALFARSA